MCVLCKCIIILDVGGAGHFAKEVALDDGLGPLLAVERAPGGVVVVGQVTQIPVDGEDEGGPQQEEKEVHLK